MAQQEESIQEVVEAAKGVVKSGQEPDTRLQDMKDVFSGLAKNHRRR